MDEGKKKRLTNIMADNIPMLRAKISLTQEDLAEKIGISRFTLIAIEKHQREMTWNTFMSLLFVFSNYSETKMLLNAIGIYSDDLNDFLNLKR